METLESLRRATQAAEDLHSVVRTMKSFAAVNIRQHERAVEALAGYSRTIELGFQVILRHKPEVLAGADENDARGLGAIVFGSDQGLCGQFNIEIGTYAAEALGREDVADAERVIAGVGARLVGQLEAEGHTVAESFSLPRSVAGITERVQDVLLCVEAWSSRRGIGRVLMFHHRPLSGATYEPVALKLLPIDMAWLRSLSERPWPTRVIPDFTMDWRDLLSSLVRQYLFIWVYRAFAESMAAENASRLASMQAAENNIEERLEILNTRYHRLRQTVVTEELLDVISGFEVLQGSKSSPRA